MLSYRHGFHAGNFADVIKHYILFYTLNYYNQKVKPYWYIDTHSGAGLYNIEDAFAIKTGEYQKGIARLLGQSFRSESLNQFTRFIEDFQKHHPNLYLGSPLFAKMLLRETDRIKLFELHPTDYEHLRENFRGSRIPYQIEKTDGFKGLIGLLPPSSRRAVVLIDPPYEEKSDYQTVINTLEDAIKRFSTGCYILWYPLLDREESLTLQEKLTSAFPENFLNASLMVYEPNEQTQGMFGSGIFIINPPYSLAEDLKETLPELTKILAQDTSADYSLTVNIK